MQKPFKVEEVSANPKLILIDFSKKEDPFVDVFLSHFEDVVSCYLFSKKKIHFKRVQTLSSLSEHFLDKLSETVEYSVILASFPERGKIVSFAQRLSKVCEKVFVILKREEVDDFFSEIESLEKLPNVGIVLLGNVFGKHFLKEQFSKIIVNSISKKEFSVGERPLSPIFLISEKDVFLGFEYLFFSGGKKTGVFPLYYETPHTITSLMHSLKLIEHELSISYSFDAEVFYVNTIDEETLKRKLRKLQEEIRKVFSGFEKGVKTLMSGDVKQFTTSQKRKKFKIVFSNFSQTFFLLITAFALFIAVSVGMLFLSVHFFQNSVDAFFAGNFNTSLQHMKKSKMLLEYSKPQISLVLSQVDFVSGGNLATYLDTFSDAVLLTDELTQASFTSNISKIDTKKVFANALVLYFIAQDRIPLDQSSFENYLPLISIFQEAAGFMEEMNYLVLFQNNNELRPTGGFIGSVAQITVKNGKIEETQVRDVYELDGQLEEHVEPHFVIRRYLQPHLYLRDSNFNPDFQMSASSAANLYFLETGKDVDGVIAIDTEVLKNLVEILGEVQIPGVDKKITKENIVPLIQDEIHDDFFPGSTEKKEILSTLLSKIIIGFENNPKGKISFLKKLPSLFSEKHIQVSFNKDHLQRGIVAAKLSGTLKDLRISKDILKDTLSINEANIGVNKINEHVTRKVSYSAYLKQQELSSDILLEYKNKGVEDYTMFLRVIVPEDALLESVTLDSQVQTIVPAVTDPVFYERRGFQPPLGLEVSEEKVTDELKAFGIRIVVPKKSEKRIRMITRRPFFELPSSFIYSLSFIKQAGTLPYPLTVTLQTEDTYKRDTGSPVLFNGEVRGDMDIETKIQKTSQ